MRGSFSRVFPVRANASLAFGTLYAEAQLRYLESVAPYAKRLFDQMGISEDSIDGLPPAVELQQQRGSPTTRSSVARGVAAVAFGHADSFVCIRRRLCAG